MSDVIPEGDYEKGKKVFKQRCLQCHVVDSMAAKTGPTLHGIIGRKSGTVPGYDYTTANKNKASFAGIDFHLSNQLQLRLRLRLKPITFFFCVLQEFFWETACSFLLIFKFLLNDT